MCLSKIRQNSSAHTMASSVPAGCGQPSVPPGGKGSVEVSLTDADEIEVTDP
jgi:hypothetical protein